MSFPPPTAVDDATFHWPARARTMLAMLENAFAPTHNRRQIPRVKYHLEVIFAGVLTGPRAVHTIYIRDINPWAVGFLASEALPMDVHGALSLPDFDGKLVRVGGVVRRCRSFAPGWYEGMIDFDSSRTNLLPNGAQGGDAQQIITRP